jgi:hypothetical protein
MTAARRNRSPAAGAASAANADKVPPATLPARHAALVRGDGAGPTAIPGEPGYRRPGVVSRERSETALPPGPQAGAPAPEKGER